MDALVSTPKAQIRKKVVVFTTFFKTLSKNSTFPIFIKENDKTDKNIEDFFKKCCLNFL